MQNLRILVRKVTEITSWKSSRKVGKYIGKGDLIMTAVVEGRRLPSKLSVTSAVVMLLEKVEYGSTIWFMRSKGKLVISNLSE